MVNILRKILWHPGPDFVGGTFIFYGFEYTFNSLDELQKAMEDYIYYYNNERITTKLKGLTPVEYRNQSLLINL